MIGAKIRRLRLSRSLTLDEVGAAIGASKQTVYKYETGVISHIPSDKIEALASLFSVSPGYLMGWDDAPMPKTEPVRVPVLGRVPAGVPLYAVEDIIGWEEVSPAIAHASDLYALRIMGDSMAPRIQDGDVVLVMPQPDVDSGDVAIVMVNSQEATCKKVIKTDGGILLQPLNPTYQPAFYSWPDVDRLPVSILGRVVELRGRM